MTNLHILTIIPKPHAFATNADKNILEFCVNTADASSPKGINPITLHYDHWPLEQIQALERAKYRYTYVHKQFQQLKLF